MDGKDLLTSRRFWGIVVAALGPLISRWFGIAPEGLEEVVDAAVVMAGAAVTIWGVLKRSKPITSIAGISRKKRRRTRG